MKTNQTNLQESIREMDPASQDGLNQIAALSWTLIKFIEQVGGDANVQHIRQVMRTINTLANVTMNDVNVTAESVGCDYQDGGQS